MSAIAGIYHLDQEAVPIDYGRKLMKALQKYPSDDVQTWHKANIFLGCHAQWITPESVDERLPYYHHESQLAITADAIIDNRLELFESLQVERAARKKLTDSELILLAYQKWREEVPKYLIGDFAFMIWDERKRQLFGARDFSGSRTLYFNRTQQRFAFCTVIRPLFSLPYIAKSLNEQWLAEFLAIPGMHDTVDPSSTVYKNIEQVPPAHSILVVGSKVMLSRYSTITAGQKLQLKSNQEYEEAFREVFQTAVTARIRSYRNVGAHLSGGLDSGSVVSFAAKALRKENKPLHTFSYIPEDNFIDWTPKHRMADERPFIHATVQHVGNITDHYLNFAEKSSLSEVNDWLETMEMPYKFFENSFWLKGICEKASQLGIGVLLNGARGNYSISWGPALDYYAVLLKKLNWIRLYRELLLYSKNIGVDKSRIMSVVGKKAFPFINQDCSLQNQEHFPLFINAEFAKRTDVFNKLQEHGMNIKNSSFVDRYEDRKKHYEQVFVWDTTGTSGAKLSLRYSLANRDPTNDLRVIRFCLSVPEEQFVHNGLDRALIRRSTESFLPDKVRLNQRVRGVQGADWVHRIIPVWHTLIEELEQLSKDAIVAEFLDVKVINAAILKVQEKPRPELAFEPDFRILMRSLIVYRFIKKLL
ncbi:MAG: lasso peptide isopeptide bond-forming cyclase [Carboxydocellales bacterium]